MRKCYVKKALFLVGILFIFAGWSVPKDHVGETAYYKVDTNPERTTSAIQKGSFVFDVARFNPETPNGPAYDMKFNYDLTITFPIGRRTGFEIFQLPESYFSPEFWEQLRRDGEFNHPKVKLKHEGYADVQTPDGRSYTHCDKVFIYDIDTSSQFLRELADALADAEGLERGHSIQDLEIHAKIKEGIPSLRAASLDISGKIDGFPFTIGADYIAKP